MHGWRGCHGWLALAAGTRRPARSAGWQWRTTRNARCWTSLRACTRRCAACPGSHRMCRRSSLPSRHAHAGMHGSMGTRGAACACAGECLAGAAAVAAIGALCSRLSMQATQAAAGVLHVHVPARRSVLLRTPPCMHWQGQKGSAALSSRHARRYDQAADLRPKPRCMASNPAAMPASECLEMAWSSDAPG